MALRMGRSHLHPCSMEGGGGETPQHLVVSLMPFAKDEEKKALKLFPVNDVDDKVD